MKLHAEKLFDDPRVKEATKLLEEALSEHKSALQKVKAPDKELKISYKKLIDSFSQVRGGNLWYPYLGSGLGNGSLVELLDGSVKYDFISGIGVHYFGHSNLDTIAPTINAAISDILIEGNLQQNKDSYLLSELFLELSGMDHCFLSSSGAMANENALKIAFQARFPAKRILAFEKAFAGRTITLSSITDKPAFRKGLPQAINVDYLPFFDPEKKEESLEKALKVLNSHLARYPNDHALLIFEPVQGEGGFYPGDERFFKTLFKRVKEEGILIFSDEVQTFGRLDTPFGFQSFHLEEFVDLATIGKLSLVTATLFKDKIKPGPGLLSQTFTGATSLIKASLLLMSKLKNEGFFGKNGKNFRINELFKKEFQKLEKQFPDKIKGPFGIGAMVAFTPFDGSKEKAVAFGEKLFEAGVISFIAGDHPTRIRFLPPIGVITEDDILKAVEIIAETFKNSP